MMFKREAKTLACFESDAKVWLQHCIEPVLHEFSMSGTGEAATKATRAVATKRTLENISE